MKKIEAPIHGTWPVVERWLTSLGPGAAPLLSAAAWSPVLSNQGFPPGDELLTELWTTGGDISWLGGPAVAGLDSWPRNDDGDPLAHVATFALRGLDGTSIIEEKEAWPEHEQGLPTEGSLEIFHDLNVYGWEASDRDRRGWLVRWVAEPDRSHLVAAPSDLDTPTEVCQAGEFMPGFSLPAPLDVTRDGDAAFEAAERAHALLDEGWRVQMDEASHALPVTHAYGHSRTGRGAVREVLNEVLPLREPADAHRLLFDIESWTHLSGWFGDAAPLEVWMRQSDLAARRFDEAWCLTRTD